MKPGRAEVAFNSFATDELPASVLARLVGWFGCCANFQGPDQLSCSARWAAWEFAKALTHATDPESMP